MFITKKEKEIWQIKFEGMVCRCNELKNLIGSLADKVNMLESKLKRQDNIYVPKPATTLSKEIFAGKLKAKKKK